jgi:hypothetical protein
MAHPVTHFEVIGKDNPTQDYCGVREAHTPSS